MEVKTFSRMGQRREGGHTMFLFKITLWFAMIPVHLAAVEAGVELVGNEIGCRTASVLYQKVHCS